MIEVGTELLIPEDELTFTASRSSGPGGQHVNKASTRVTLLFDVARSPSLSDEQRRVVLDRLESRVTREGVLRVVSQRHRSQRANRDAAVERLVELLRLALHRETPRKPTRVSRTAKRRRVEVKKQRGELKRRRSSVPSRED